MESLCEEEVQYKLLVTWLETRLTQEWLDYELDAYLDRLENE
jgi:hypothetical protein